MNIYKDMYFALLSATMDIMERMVEVQQEVEEMLLSHGEGEQKGTLTEIGKREKPPG